MRIGILGTGTLATALGTAWARAGHEIAIAGRSREKAEALAWQIPSATAADPRSAVRDRDAVLLAVLWPGVPEMLRLAGAPDGTLRGTTLIDPTNAVEHGVGVLLTAPGTSSAEQITALAPGANVVKAFHLFAADEWLKGRSDATVALCGDDPTATELVGRLVKDVGATPALLGPLARARQVEEVAGFVIGLAFAGVDPRSAVPQVG